MRWVWVLGALAAAVALAACGSSKPRAGAIAVPTGALAYLRGGNAVIAKPGGRDPRVLGPAQQALLAPDGTAVIGLNDPGGRVALSVYAVKRRRVVPRVVAVLAPPDYSTRHVELRGWSPDSRYVVLSANEISSAGEEGALLVLDTRDGELQTITRGTLLGASFAPSLPDRLVYARASIVQLDDNESSVWVARVDGTQRQLLTSGALAGWPLWTAGGIYFARLERLGTRTASPVYGLWRIKLGKGRGVEEIPGLSGGPPAGPLFASASGRRVVANLDSRSGGAVEVWAAQLGRAGWSVAQLSVGGIADGVSSDGKLILANVFGARPLIDRLRWGGGSVRVLATDAGAAGWNQ